MSSSDEYFTAEEEEEDVKTLEREELYIQELGFYLHITEDGTRWYLPICISPPKNETLPFIFDGCPLHCTYSTVVHTWNTAFP
jgi:hypothetical protein|tara:strand:+ start:7544 stop:7792 length:249 start_codon:yes stop_codon:yes gene_type:complete